MKKKSSKLKKIWKRFIRTASRVGENSIRVGEHIEKGIGEGIEVKVVRGKDDKRTHVDESKEGPVQGFYIGAKKGAADNEPNTEEQEKVISEASYTWWKDVRFILPTSIGVVSIVVSIILWLLR